MTYYDHQAIQHILWVYRYQQALTMVDGTLKPTNMRTTGTSQYFLDGTDGILHVRKLCHGDFRRKPRGKTKGGCPDN
jgi:hypothetical protein